jgi:predicted dehydrogenase
MNKLRFAIVGLGHGASYIENIRNHPRAELAAVVDVNPERLRKANAPGFTNLDAFLAVRVADAVVIATPNPLHASQSIACLDAGLHVLQCKALCCNDAEADAIGEAVKRSGCVFQIGFEFRSSPLHRAILDHIRRGDLGEVTNVWWHQHRHVEFYPEWDRVRTNMGGSLFNCAVHFLDLIQQWAGAPVHRLVALGNGKGKIGLCREEMPDNAAISLEYKNGVRGTYNFGCTNRFSDDASFGVAGTTGRIMGNPNHAGSFELRTNGGAQVAQVVIDPQLTGTGHLGMREELDHFVRTVLDDAPNACSCADALAIHRMMTAIDRSLATGQVITLG